MENSLWLYTLILDLLPNLVIPAKAGVTRLENKSIFHTRCFSYRPVTTPGILQNPPRGVILINDVRRFSITALRPTDSGGDVNHSRRTVMRIHADRKTGNVTAEVVQIPHRPDNGNAR